MAAVPLAQRAAIRARINGSEGQTPQEILKNAKTVIKGAYAVKLLRSGDVEVLVKDQADKDRALNQPPIEGIKILRQDYPVEIAAVPLSLRINSGRNADNATLIQELTKATKQIIPTFTANKIRWLNDAKTLSIRKAAGKTQSTVILSLPTQAIQHEVIRKGIIIESQHFEVTMFDHGMQAKLCFNCNGWGHTQSACGKEAKCGHCAGDHQTKNCDKKSISCVNCGKRHCAWQKKECKTFATYLIGLQEKRATAYAQTVAIRSHNAGVTPARLQTDGFQEVRPKKRLRSPSNVSASGRRAGRPAYFEQVVKDPRQPSILSSMPPPSFQAQPASQTTSSSGAATPTSSSTGSDGQLMPSTELGTTDTEDNMDEEM
jgi:hypothetical protein